MLLQVVYVTALLPYLLLLVILIRGVTLPGAVDGIILFLKPDVQKLMTLQVYVKINYRYLGRNINAANQSMCSRHEIRRIRSI